jgi:hypothetical protein
VGIIFWTISANIFEIVGKIEEFVSFIKFWRIERTGDRKG